MLLKQQRGISLIELMIAMVLGLLVSAIVIGMYGATIASTKQAVTTIRLNQELRIAMDTIVRDIRRAGYSSADDVASNAYASLIRLTATASGPVGVFGDYSSYPNLADTASQGDCIMMGYDSSIFDTASGGERVVGYRYGVDSGIGYIAAVWGELGAGDPSPVICNTSAYGSWQKLTDERMVDITNLDFIFRDEAASYAAVSLASFAQSTVKSVRVAISAKSVIDPNIKADLLEYVRIRGDL
jgi:prepilin-type N-terminal cleavage/methylation domain-containing protein